MSEKVNNVMFESINVYSVSACSGIFVGENIQYNWEVDGKINTAAGSMVGDCNVMAHVVNVVYDNDGIDMFTIGNGENGEKGNE